VLNFQKLFGEVGLKHVSRRQISIRVVLISDTHSQHERLGQLPHGDLLIHAGDFVESRPPKLDEYIKFMDWFASQPHPQKVLISGNRDQLMDTASCLKDEKSLMWMSAVQDYVKGEDSVTYLQDQATTINVGGESVKVWGSPWTPIYGKPGKAFQIARDELGSKWEKIASDTDILVTHSPPRGTLDKNAASSASGCAALAKELSSRLRPRLHVFGHIHESYGSLENRGTLYVNASSRRPRSKEANPPVVIELDSDRNVPCIRIQ